MKSLSHAGGPWDQLTSGITSPSVYEEVRFIETKASYGRRACSSRTRATRSAS